MSEYAFSIATGWAPTGGENDYTRYYYLLRGHLKNADNETFVGMKFDLAWGRGDAASVYQKIAISADPTDPPNENLRIVTYGYKSLAQKWDVVLDAAVADQEQAIFQFVEADGNDEFVWLTDEDEIPANNWIPVQSLSFYDKLNGDLQLYFEREMGDANDAFTMAPGDELNLSIKATGNEGGVFDVMNKQSATITWATVKACPEGQERLAEREAQGGKCLAECLPT